MKRTAALPRSSLHLALLQANDPGISLVLYRDARLKTAVESSFPGKGLFLGREERLQAKPLAALKQFYKNQRYYRTVRELLKDKNVDRLIIFLEGEPLERMLVESSNCELELWEDGLSHYIDLTGPIWYALRGFAQIISGFYFRGAMKRRADRSQFLIRDRFEHKNLILPPLSLARPEENILFIGSPLVEDGIISRTTLRKGLARIASSSAKPLRYLPHPRENFNELLEMFESIDRLEMAPLPHGIAQHAETHGYRAFIAAVSTALLDLGAFERSFFVPALFGQSRMHKALKEWPNNPVRVVSELSEILTCTNAL